MFTIHTPSKSTFTAGDEASAQLLLTLPLMRNFLASAVQMGARANHDVIVSRCQSSDRADMQKVEIEFFIDSDAAFDEDGIKSVHACVSEWARRSNVRGTSGARLACVSDLTQSAKTGSYLMTAEVSTTVFYNERRVTVNFPASTQEFTLDVDNLLERLGSVGASGSSAGIAIRHPEFGDIVYGNMQSAIGLETHLTEIRAIAGCLSAGDPGALVENLGELIAAAKAVLDALTD